MSVDVGKMKQALINFQYMRLGLLIEIEKGIIKNMQEDNTVPESEDLEFVALVGTEIDRMAMLLQECKPFEFGGPPKEEK